MFKVCGYPPTVEEEFLSHLPKPAKSLARVPSLRVRLVILPGGIPVPGSVEGFVRNSFPTSVRAILLLLIYKASAYSNWYTAIRLYSVSRTWSALNIVKQPCVESLELLNEMKE